MKQNIRFIILSIMIIAETIILANQNQKVKNKINDIFHEFETNNLVVENKINLDSLKQTKIDLKEYAQTVFQQDDIELAFENQNKLSEELNKEISILENTIINIENDLGKLQKEYNVLYKQYQEKNTFYITNFPLINQYPNYPTGCESVALTMLLNYYGVLVTPDDIITSLPRGDLPYTKGGITYGGNPEKEFIGNPYSLNSYGVYEKPLAEVANKYKPGITIATGTDFNTILGIVGSGKPVIAWTSMYLAAPYISASWVYEPTGEKIYWKANEHAVVIIGYTPDKVIISDPIGGTIKYQSLSLFKERYNYYGKKALYYR